MPDKKDTNKQFHDRLQEARLLLFLHDMITEKDNEKIKFRLEKWCKRRGVETIVEGKARLLDNGKIKMI